MNQTISIALAALGLASLVGLVTAEQSEANDRWRRTNREVDRRNNRSDGGELGRDRAELRRDQAELERDRADLSRLYRRGASRSEIERKKVDIHNDLREVAQDRREVWDDYGSLRGESDRYRTGGWSDDRWRHNDGNGWNWGDGWWNSGWDRSHR